MPRKPRLPHCPGEIFHVIGRGNGGEAIIHDDEDAECFFRALKDIKQRAPFDLYAYCLMTNHYHLLIRVGETPLSTIMRRFLTAYAMRLHIRYESRGHVFEARYKALHCQRDSYFMQLLRYIHLNPVRAGLAQDPATWPWSGHGELLGNTVRRLIDRAFPLSLFGGSGMQVAGYAEFMGALKGGVDADFDPYAPIEAAVDERPKAAEAIFERKDALGRIGARAAAMAGISVEELLSRSAKRATSAARRSVIDEGRRQGYSCTEIGRYLGRGVSAICQALRRAEANVSRQ